MSGLIMGMTAGAFAFSAASTAIAAGSAIASGVRSGNAKKRAQGEERMAAKKLAALEKGRQQVIDQSGKIRDMKKQVFNPYENLAVANKASELQIEQTDQALANSLDQINQSGTGSGGATALARMAAASKAQVGASLEKGEVENQKLRAEGEAKADATKMTLEQNALTAETSAWDRQETRDLTQLDRLSGQQENAQAQAQSFAMQQNQAYMGAASAVAGFGTDLATSSGAAKNNWLGGVDPNRDLGYQDNSMVFKDPTTGVESSYRPGYEPGGIHNPNSDRRLKENIIHIGKSSSGLNIYTFEYINKSLGEGTWQGVMSDEIPKVAVIKGDDGYDRVDYSKLDVEFKKVI